MPGFDGPCIRIVGEMVLIMVSIYTMIAGALSTAIRRAVLFVPKKL